MGHRSRLRLHSVEGIPNGGVLVGNPKAWWWSRLVDCDSFQAHVLFVPPFRVVLTFRVSAYVEYFALFHVALR